MKLYHGSNVEVQQPKILPIVKTSDFGSAFYTTSNFNQTLNWSKTKVRRRKKGNAIVSIYEFNEAEAFEILKVKEFLEPTEEWLDFVVLHRSGQYRGDKFDLIIGPVADDQAITVLDDYMTGMYTKKIALELLKPQNLVDQYAFATANALKHISCIGVEQYEI